MHFYLPERGLAHIAPECPWLATTVFSPQHIDFWNPFLLLHVFYSLLQGTGTSTLNSTKHQDSSSVGLKHQTVSF